LTKIPANKIARFIAANEKIMDIAQGHTTAVTCTIATKVPPNTVAVLLMVERMAGTSAFYVYPNEGSQEVSLVHLENIAMVAIGNQRIKFAQASAPDDFDLYMMGYLVEGTVKTA